MEVEICSKKKAAYRYTCDLGPVKARSTGIVAIVHEHHHKMHQNCGINEADLNKSQKTNNVSEKWHNRFRLVMRKQYPYLYSAITEIQKGESFTEVCVADLGLGKRKRLFQIGTGSNHRHEFKAYVHCM